MIQITDQDARTTSSTQGGESLGQLATTPGGRIYAYAQAGASNLVAAKNTSCVANVTNSTNQTGVATSAGDTQVTFTVGATAVAADQYKDGYLAVNEGPGQNLYGIAGNTAATSGNSYSITVYLKEPITVATTTSSKFSLYPSQEAGVILYPNASGPALQSAGVPNVAVTAAYYFWNQVGGLCTVLNDGIIGVNSEAIPSNAVDGAVEVRVDATVTHPVGYAPYATVDAKYYPIVLTMVGL